MKLKSLQREFADCLRVPLTASERTRRTDRRGRSMSKRVSRFIKPNERLTALERMELYNRQYWFRILSCFYEDFPGLRLVLGNRNFERLAQDYLEACPSRSFTLRNLGSRLVPWLIRNKRRLGPNAVAAIEMARLEWAHIEAFDSGESPRLQTDEVLKAGAGLRLALQPYVRLLRLNYPVDELLLESKSGSSGNTLSSNAVAAPTQDTKKIRSKKLRQTSVFLAVHRLDYSVYYKRLEPEAFALLEGLYLGKTLAQATLGAFKKKKMDGPQQARLLGQWFTEWSALGWLCPRMKKTVRNKP